MGGSPPRARRRATTRSFLPGSGARNARPRSRRYVGDYHINTATSRSEGLRGESVPGEGRTSVPVFVFRQFLRSAVKVPTTTYSARMPSYLAPMNDAGTALTVAPCSTRASSTSPMGRSSRIDLGVEVDEARREALHPGRELGLQRSVLCRRWRARPRSSTRRTIRLETTPMCVRLTLHAASSRRKLIGSDGACDGAAAGVDSRLPGRERALEGERAPARARQVGVQSAEVSRSNQIHLRNRASAVGPRRADASPGVLRCRAVRERGVECS